MDSGFQVSDSLSVELGFQIPIVSGIPDSLSCFLDSKANDSGLLKQIFPDSGFRRSVFPYMGRYLILRNENVDVLDIKNVNRKLIFSLLCSDVCLEKLVQRKLKQSTQTRCARRTRSFKRDIELPVAIHDVWNASVLVAKARY